MQIRIKDASGQRSYTVQVDLHEPPTVVKLEQTGQQAITLDWDRAVDDENHLRHCPVCGSEGLYTKKPMPRVITFALIALAAVVAMIILGLAHVMWAVVVFFIILLIDLTGWFLRGKSLACYNCHSEFNGVPIRRGHPGWNPEEAQKYSAPTKTQPDTKQAAPNELDNPADN